MNNWENESNRITKRIKAALPKNHKATFFNKLPYRVPTERIYSKHLEKVKQILEEEDIELNVDKIAKNNTIPKTDIIHEGFIGDLKSRISNVLETRDRCGFL